MFKSLRYVGVQQDLLGYDYFVFHLEDDLFTTSFRTNQRGRIYVIQHIIEIYKDRKLNVPKNVSLFYVQYLPKSLVIGNVIALKREMALDVEFLDAHEPTLGYGKFYYKCVQRHINSFLWTRGFK